MPELTLVKSGYLSGKPSREWVPSQFAGALPSADMPPTGYAEDGDAAWRADLSAALAALPELDSHSPMKAWSAADLLDEDDTGGSAEAD